MTNTEVRFDGERVFELKKSQNFDSFIEALTSRIRATIGEV